MIEIVKYKRMMDATCPYCGWNRNLLVIHRSRSKIKKYQIQCSHCLWVSKPSLFKWLALRRYKNKDGSMTIRRERQRHE